MSPFRYRVIQIVRSVPERKVVSYGQVAVYAGMPRAARQVGWILSSTEEDLPWWRVVNKDGRITIRGARSADKTLQKKLLEAEGIPVSDDFQLDMGEYRFTPERQLLVQFELDPEYIEMIHDRYQL